MGQVSKILQRRSPVVFPLRSEQTVREAVGIMAEHSIGAVPIVDDRDHLIGIFSERDLVKRVLARGRPPEKTALGEVMTPNPVTASPADERLVAVHKMQEAHCRHLPVVADGVVIDMMSMRDLLFVELEEKIAEIGELRRYISGG